MEWARKQKDVWVPWLEDMYLYYFTNHNKASYVTKDTLDQTKVTGIEGVDKLQDTLHDGVAGQLGQGGLLQPVGDLVSKQAINKAEESGYGQGYIPDPATASANK